MTIWEETIARCKPTIWAEHLEQRDNDGALKKALQEIGYMGWRFGTRMFVEPNTRRETHNPFGAMEGDTNVLAVPADAPIPTGLEAMERWV